LGAVEAGTLSVVGREEELAEISSFLDGREALPAGLLVAGEAGIGKTTIWRRGLELARDRGYRVLSAHPSGSETELSFAALGDLLDGVFDEAVADLPPPQRAALATAVHLEEPGERPPQPTAIGFALLGTLRTLARTRPTVVAVDDLQWLDAASAAALGFAVRRLRTNEAIGVLVAVRSDDGAEPPWLSEAFDGRLRRLSVGPLTLGALHQLLRTRLGASLPRPTLRRVHETAGGNPFFGLELARSLRGPDPAGRLDPELPLPRTLEGLVLDRVADLPTDTKDALLVVAAVPNVSTDVLGKALGHDPEPALVPAVNAQVVEIVGGRVRFSHPLFAEVVYARADAAQRRALHAQLALLVAAPEAQAHHYALSRDSADSQAASALEDAAMLTLRRGAPARAAELLEQARRLTPGTDAEEWIRRSIACAEASARAGDPKRGEQILRHVVDGAAAGPDRARALVELAWWTTDLDLCERASAEADGDVELELRIASIRALIHGVEGDYRAMLAAGRVAVTKARAVGAGDLIAFALSLLGLAETVTGLRGALQHLEEGERLDEGASARRIYSSPASVIARRLMWHDDLDEARRRFEHQRQRALDLGDEESGALLCAHLAEIECLAGNWHEAEEYAEELATFIDQSGGETGDRAVGVLPHALLAGHRGDVETALRLARAGVDDAESAGWQLWAAKNLAVLGFLEVSQGEYATALEWLLRLDEKAERMGVVDPGVLRFAPDLVEALVGVGRLEEADRRIAAYEECGQQLGRRSALAAAARCRGLLLAARGDLDGALTELERSVSEFAPLGLPLERARTLLALGKIRRRAKQKRAARESLEQALQIFDELGARLWAERCREELARIGGRVRSAEELTPTERRVAELVAEGRANKEVAAALFVTVKAVEANLSRVYAKLGVRSRAELAGRIARAGKV
jgi:DNA-binding CsgD family transcriptional regulator